MAGKSPGITLRRFIRMLQPDRREIGYIYLYAVLVGLIALAGPLGVQAIINLIAGGAMSASLVILVIVVTAATIFVGVLKVMQYVVAETIQRRLFTRAALEFAYRLPRIRSSSLSDHYPPELVNRFFDTVTVQKGLPKILMDASGAVMQIIFGLILVAFYHPFFAIFGAALAVFLFLLVRVLAPRGMRTSLQESKYKYAVAGWLEDIARTNNTFKLAGGASLSMRRTDKLIGGYLDSRISHFRILLFQYGGLVAFQALVTFGFLLLGGYLVIENLINIGQFVAAELVILLVLGSAEKVIFSLETIYDTLTGVEKLASVTDLPLEESGTLSFYQLKGDRGMEVEVRQLSFKYEDAKRNALQRINLHLKPNRRLCVAGYNRSGRATLMQIIAGLRQDFTGQLLYNHTPVGNLDLDTLRQNIGDYSVHEDLIPGNLIDNICLGHPDTTFDDIQWALETAELKDWLAEQPDGYDTMLVAQGLNVPRSVRTRLLLARAVVRRPRLLVLGNLVEHLEPKIRKRIVERITAPDNCWTLVIASNDPAVAMLCDEVVVLRYGRLQAHGDPREILRLKDFSELWTIPQLPNA